MMAYATVQDMIGRFGETEMLRLSSVDGELPETVNAAPVEQAIADADGIIDSYLRKRYSVPLLPVPRAITNASCVLARYELSVGGDREPADQVKAGKKDIVAWLTQLANGIATLEDAAPIAPTSSAQTSDRERMFGRHGERGL
jgi:phage gp36-like protein